jgi:hypothetical protein
MNLTIFGTGYVAQFQYSHVEQLRNIFFRLFLFPLLRTFLVLSILLVDQTLCHFLSLYTINDYGYK